MSLILPLVAHDIDTQRVVSRPGPDCRDRSATRVDLPAFARRADEPAWVSPTLVDKSALVKPATARLLETPTPRDETHRHAAVLEMPALDIIPLVFETPKADEGPNVINEAVWFLAAMVPMLMADIELDPITDCDDLERRTRRYADRWLPTDIRSRLSL